MNFYENWLVKMLMEIKSHDIFGIKNYENEMKTYIQFD